MNKSQSMGMYVILGIMVLAFVSMLIAGPNTSTKEISYTEFLNKVNVGEIKSVQIEKDNSFLVAEPVNQISVEQNKKTSETVNLFYGEQKAPVLLYKVYSTHTLDN